MNVRPQVKQRAEEQASAMNTDQQAAIRVLANDLHRLNQAVMQAVEAGVSVELVRSARHHGGNGNWGDLLIPVVVTQAGLRPVGRRDQPSMHVTPAAAAR